MSGTFEFDRPLDQVLEHQLAPLEPGELELVSSRLGGEELDALVEPAVLGAQCIQRKRRMVVVQPASTLLDPAFREEQRIGLDGPDGALAEPSEGSRQKPQFVIYYGAVTSA